MTTRDDLVSRLRKHHEAMLGPDYLESAARIERLQNELDVADKNHRQMAKQMAELGRQLAAETERCACIAQDNRQHSNQIVMRTLEAESAYEEACDDIAAAIRGGASEDDGD